MSEMSLEVEAGFDTNRRPDVSRKWVSTYGLLYFATCISWAAPSQILLANQMDFLSGLEGGNKEAMLGMLMTIGGAIQVFASLIAGSMSDITNTRIGKRLPWILIGVFGASAALVALSFTPSYWMMVATWGAFQFFTVLSTNNILTLAPDTVPQRQYGKISGVLGATYTLGMVAGTIFAAVLPLRQAYIAIVVLFIAIMMFYVYSGTWKHSVEIHASEREEREAAKALMEQQSQKTKFHFRDYVDYFWVFAARFVVHLGNYVALFFLFYYLQDHVCVLGSPKDIAKISKVAEKCTEANSLFSLNAETGVMILTVAYALFTVISAIIGGQWSDKLQKRKIFVVLAAVLAGLASMAMALVESFPLVIAAGVVLGIAWGTFTSVDQALINEVLPHPETRARDMSLMTLTVGITNMMAGVTAAFALSAFGGYPGLYLVSGAVTVLGAFLVLPVKRSK
ncbi:MAG: MFS transporter [Arcanobacterium sp.]|nr:MFS transporter [Arcanobacterium sp.]